MITDILRDELGFEGIIITDSMQMVAITKEYTSEQAAVGAIVAGVDMILMPKDFEEAYQGVLDAVASGTITEERINESLHRIFCVKYKYTSLVN
jgi:beta-N-acetylhexosaminidase